jgi:calcineurin-like phosphoesterase family protein
VSDVWFTADTHFSHRMLVEKGHRPFATVEDMNDALITGWNETVRPGDVVWHLGDWAMGPARAHLPILGQLHGTVHLIAGNHDAPWPGFRDAHKHQAVWVAAGFASVQAFARRRIGGREVMLSHFPYEGDHVDGDRGGQYRLRAEGLPVLHGHVHDAWLIRSHGPTVQVNVGVDVRGFRPVHLDHLAAVLAVET